MKPVVVGPLRVVREAGLWFLVPLLVALVGGTVLGWSIHDHVSKRRAYQAACPVPSAARTCCDVCGLAAVATVRVEGWVGRRNRRYMKQDLPVCGQHRGAEPWSVRNARFDRDSIVSYGHILFPAGFFFVVSLIWIVTVLRQVRDNVRERIAAGDPWETS